MKILKKKNFLKELDKEWKKDEKKSKKDENIFPFFGGWFVYLGYELVSQIENKIVSHEAFVIIFQLRLLAEYQQQLLKIILTMKLS